jgi:hypothetical protein
MSASKSTSPARDEPLRGVKAGRVTLLPRGVAFTAVHASHMGGSIVAYAPQAEMSCLCGHAEQRTVMGVRMSARWHERPEPGGRPLWVLCVETRSALPVDGGDLVAGGRPVRAGD